MKTVVIILLAMLAFSSAYAQTTKTFSSTHSVAGVEQLYTPSFVEVEYKEIEGSRMIIETKVSSNTKEAVVDFMSAQGFFSPQVETTQSGEAVIVFPDYDKMNSLFIRGVQVETKLKLTIYVPKSIGMVASK